MFIDEDPLEQRLYPDSDGKTIGDSTLEFDWVMQLVTNLEAMYTKNPNVFVAGALLWYPVKGEPTILTGPSAMVVFGRPKGDRHSYRQWREGDIAPQVVFEVQSHLATPHDLDKKRDFYDRYGVEEYYLYDPYKVEAFGWLREPDGLRPIQTMHGWVSPRTELHFDVSGAKLVIRKPNGKRFATFLEAFDEYQAARQKLRDLGIDPDA